MILERLCRVVCFNLHSNASASAWPPRPGQVYTWACLHRGTGCADRREHGLGNIGAVSALYALAVYPPIRTCLPVFTFRIDLHKVSLPLSTLLRFLCIDLYPCLVCRYVCICTYVRVYEQKKITSRRVCAGVGVFGV